MRVSVTTPWLVQEEALYTRAALWATARGAWMCRRCSWRAAWPPHKP